MINKNIIVKLSVVIQALSFVVACGADDNDADNRKPRQPNDVVVVKKAAPEPTTYKAERPSKNIDPSLAPFLQLFLDDAAKHGVTGVDENSLVRLTFDEGEGDIRGSLGFCVSPDFSAGRDWVEIGVMPLEARFKKSSIESLTREEYLSLAQTIYHELGHCLLFLDHSKDTAKVPSGFSEKIMSPRHSYTTKFFGAVSASFEDRARRGSQAYKPYNDETFNSILKEVGVVGQENVDRIYNKIKTTEESLMGAQWQKTTIIGGTTSVVIDTVTIDKTNIREAMVGGVYRILYTEMRGELTKDEISDVGFRILAEDLFKDALDQTAPRYKRQ